VPESEFELIRRLAEVVGRRGAGVDVGVGDDAAVLGDLVATVDALVEAVHFRLETTSLEDLGWKALAVNVSDLAAMGARPLGALVALIAPPTLTGDAVAELYRGLEACAQAYGCPSSAATSAAGPCSPSP
jgi:thiamine-monophosphate kinase